MFILSEIEDLVRVKPGDLWKPRAEAVTDVLHKKYANKVVHDLGLCIQVFDILSIGDAIIHACQDGSYQSKVLIDLKKVVFRVIVFRPFMDEIIIGSIATQSQEGIRVTIGFFSDILIPAHKMRPGTIFYPKESVWCWQIPNEGSDTTELFLDKGLDIQFRVKELKFADVGPMERDRQLRAAQGRSTEEELEVPLHIIFDVNEGRYF
ncbi:DNA-directed RNA polymerase III subunit rpc25 [Nowakowskiella sp. JEL0078]|nr:DNA-directed RNA polymerase III subunit rpc25 [Nowakowskiella sp. JEL0078]